jgi:membrane associated rhomboid family serine protease
VVDVVRRVGLRRVPVVTAVVWALTAAVNVVQLAAASLGLLPTLERTPAALHGQWWRIGTALFVQDGGVPGTVSNLAFLAVLGALTEQVLSPPRWLLQYFGAGLAGQLFGYVWQPVGGGNSVAVCGLAGVLVLAVGRGDVRLPAYAAPAVLFWCGALLGTLAPVLVVPAVVAGALAMRLATIPWLPGVVLGRAVAALAVPAIVVLLVARDVHGGALAVGVALGALTYRRPPERRALPT